MLNENAIEKPLLLRTNVVKVGEGFYAAIGQIFESEREDHRCPECGSDPHGTAEYTTMVAYADFSRRRKLATHEGETESDDVWNNQSTLYYKNLPALECSECHCFYITPNIREVK